MDASQRAMVAAKMANIKSGDFHGNQHTEVGANLHSPQVTRAQAAKLMNVSPSPSPPSPASPAADYHGHGHHAGRAGRRDMEEPIRLYCEGRNNINSAEAAGFDLRGRCAGAGKRLGT